MVEAFKILMLNDTNARTGVARKQARDKADLNNTALLAISTNTDEPISYIFENGSP